MSKDKNRKKNSWGCNLLISSLVVLCILIGYALLIIKYIDDWEHRGLFGDLFGAVNALFSGLAFAGLIITIRQQHKDLDYQRQAIEQTNEEMQNQTEEFEKQNATFKKQQFENTFFKMLEVQQNIVNDLFAADSHKEYITEDNPNNLGRLQNEVLIRDEYRGRNLFYYVFQRCEHYVEVDDSGIKRRISVNGLREVIYRKGKSHFDDYYTTTVFDHYFRHIYTILKFITENDWLGKDSQYQYATFVRATLSRYELVMLYYNGFFHPKMKKMMEKYCLLNNLRKELLPMSYEYKSYLQNIGLDIEDLQKSNFSRGDFEFYLTESKDDESKYYIGAFYTPKELNTGIELLHRWNSFMMKASKDNI